MGSDKLKEILFFFDSRATFAYSNNIIKQFKKNKTKFKIMVSGNYLENKMKINQNIFKANNLKISSKIKFHSPNQSLSSWPISFGKAMINYAKELKKLKPDLIVLTGDRIETLCMCITSAYMNIPIAHIQAGDKSGHIDDVSRSAIAKFSNLHFAPSLEACKRLKEWGEEKKRIFFTGAPQLDDIKFKKNIKKDYYILIYHPILNEKKFIKEQILNIINAIKISKLNIYWIYPNNDMGFTNIIKKIDNIKDKRIKIIPNLERKSFLNLLSHSKGLIGNSSAGIIEASLFKIPVINIGKRQEGRPQSKNIVNCKPKTKDILKKINYISKNKKFLKVVNKIDNPYYVSNSSKIIFKIIRNLKKNNKLLTKY